MFKPYEYYNSLNLFSCTLFMAGIYLWINEIGYARLHIFSRMLGIEKMVLLFLYFLVKYFLLFFLITKNNKILSYTVHPCPLKLWLVFNLLWFLREWCSVISRSFLDIFCSRDFVLLSTWTFVILLYFELCSQEKIIFSFLILWYPFLDSVSCLCIYVYPNIHRLIIYH